ncbi:MAG: AAA family ATPase [Deltaproteobacteria bacterium]|nr:AAA family ATPase [Deltaproteobacteria bacterium]
MQTAPEPLVNPRLVQEALSECERAIHGKRAALEATLCAVLGGGHVLLEDVPGVGKTTLCRALARVLGCRFRRIQFTSDMLPSDVIGVQVLNPKDGTLQFRPGPVFANVVLADEINRASPKTQSALLEAMSDRQVTVDDVTHVLTGPFVVLATQNPVEHHGAYPLPESQLDRFMLRLELGYPDEGTEREMLTRPDTGAERVDALRVVLEPQSVIVLQGMVRMVRVESVVADYLLALVRRTREHPMVELGVSPRGSHAFLRAVQARAFVAGRGYVIPDDVKAMADAALTHRLLLRGGSDGREARDAARAVITEIVETQDVPV